MADETPVPAEEMLGERLFLESRFAQTYSQNPALGDPVLEKTETIKGRQPGPFKGSHMSCRSCHMVDEHKDTTMTGMRTYADFARRSPVPSREDGQTRSLRNSQSLVGISQNNSAVFHHDGEFPSLPALVRATFTGRNMGWLAGEEHKAVQHIANIIRNDDGKGELAKEFGGTYRDALQGKSEGSDLAAKYQIDISKATDAEIFDAVAKLVSTYVASLDFSRNEQGEYNGSAYDAFLTKNKLPRAPKDGESDKAYTQRLYKAVKSLGDVSYIENKDGQFKLHKQEFRFSEQELTGMRIFFGKGNCVSCHTPPSFSDYNFHNTGVTQAAYDASHGDNAFMKLSIPDVDAQNNTSLSPDLGIWKVIGNPKVSAEHKETLSKILCGHSCLKSVAVEKSIAAFKTPLLRDMGHNAPYMHNGNKNKLEDVLAHYVQISEISRNGNLRNSSSDIKEIALTNMDIKPLAAFLRALNEDYE
ncbi:MAG: hypothetical protein KAT90_04625 [Gammaproteobacteria bacterium]|nr:hypothetical protein [Gammaproteobacteria bacterium]